jgi:hypothetical protein
MADLDVSALLARRAAEGELARAQREVSSIDLSGDLKAAIADRDRRAVAHVATKQWLSAKEAWAAHPDNPINKAAPETPQKPPEMSDFQRRMTGGRISVAAPPIKTYAPAKTVEIERKLETPKVSQQEADALELQAAIDKKAQWDAALVSERALYLKELTAQAHAKAVAHVAQHQKHIDNEPLLFGREQWERQRQGLENRDHDNKREWEQLKDGYYPFLSNDKEAVQGAVERRVRDKKPELALSMPGVYAAFQTGRERVALAEAQARAEKAKYREVDKALSAFEAHALKREVRTASYGGYGDAGQRWNAITEEMRGVIDGYNSVPKEARPIVLERMRESIKRDPQAVEKFEQQLGQAKEHSRNQGMSR